jgi:putative NADPH-quinone reductase
MAEPVLTKEGQEALDKFLNMRPPIIKEEYKGKIFHRLSLLMKAQGCKEAGKELVFEAMRMVFTKGYDPLFHMIEDPAKFKKMSIDPASNIDAYYSVPIQVRRWERLAIEPAKRPDEMKVLAICASPRKGGNTDVLIDEALRGATDAGAKVEKIMLQKLKVNPCLACGKCKQPGFEGFCAQKDDMSAIFQKIMDSDAIILGFPIYSGRECAQLAAFFDRWYCLEGRRIELGGRALVIGTWGYPYVDTYDFVISEIISILNIFRIIAVEVISACGFYGMLQGLDENRKAIILRFPKELEKAYQSGKMLVTGQA